MNFRIFFLYGVALIRDICLMQEPVCVMYIRSAHLRKNIFSPIRMACIISFRVWSDGYEVLYGNQSLMTELGINQIPQTWEELEMLVRQVAAYNAAHDTS